LKMPKEALRLVLAATEEVFGAVLEQCSPQLLVVTVTAVSWQWARAAESALQVQLSP